MTTDERMFFELLDDHVRARHGCFLAEMNFRTEEVGYYLCFRPLGGSPYDDSSARYACKYLSILPEEMEAAARKQELPPSFVNQLDDELKKLRLRAGLGAFRADDAWQGS